MLVSHLLLNLAPKLTLYFNIMDKVITEVSPLSEKDCFYMMDRDKECFSYPLHKHEEMELNFVENCDGARRIVGDSIEVLGKYDLVLVGSGLEHTWDQYDCQSLCYCNIMIAHYFSLNEPLPLR